MKIVLFDFCDTLVSFQTADAYTDYVVDTCGCRRVRHRAMLYEYLRHLKWGSIFLARYGYLNKRMNLWKIKGISKSVLEEKAEKFYREKILPNLHRPVIDILKAYQQGGYKTYIVSGGYEIYLRFFVEEYELDGLFSTRLKYKRNNIFSGHVLGKDCMDEEKVRKLERYFKGKKIEDSISYSDSISDLPLLKWTKRGVVVSKYRHRDWPPANGLEQIVLKDMETGHQ